MPVALICGELDKSTAVLFTRENREAMKQIRIKIIEGAGHAAHLTHYDEVNAHLINYLKEAAD